MAESRKKSKENSEPKENKEKKKKNSDLEEDYGDSKPFRFNPASLISPNAIRIYGLLLILFSIFMFFACVSYLGTGKADEDKVAMGWSLLFQSDFTVENVLGKFGALMSHLFIYKWFGIASFALIFVIFVLGFRLLTNIKLIRLKSLLINSFFIIVWLPVFFALFFSTKENFFLGGAFGYFLNKWISTAIGSIGTGFLLFFALIAFLAFYHGVSFAWVLDIFKAKPKELAQEDTEEAQPKINKLKTQETGTSEDPDNDYEDESEEDEDFEIVEEPFIKNNSENSDNIETANPGQTITEDNGITFTIVEQPTSEASETLPAEPEPEPEPELVLQGDYDPTLELAHYVMPSTDLLIDYEVNNTVVTNEELTSNKDRIVKTLSDYGITIDHIQATIGPTVTLYEIIPKAGTRISKIQNLEKDIALSLAALGIRIIAPMPGKGTIGIEVPNSKPQIVSMKTMIESEKFQNTKFDLPIAIGKTISNEIYIADLAKMPHLLMAGATGQGKSVGLNAILTSLLYKKHPALVKFVLVDPKKVELTLFNKIERHYLAKLPDEEEPIITDVKKVVKTLNSLCKEMETRYDLLKKAEVRTIKEYNAKFISRKLNPLEHRFLPYIVLIVDEFADLIMTAGREVETPIARLAQLARAVGIHLIIATQRPSVNIITGIIKANFPARIAFRVTSRIDSRTILDTGGAEQLIGRGDMLLSTGSDLIRLQCPLVDTPEISALTEFIGNQSGFPNPFFLPEVADESTDGGGKDIDAGERDALFEEAARLIVSNQMGSTSLIQRKMKLGYNRAGRIMDQLESAGIVGPSEGSKPREVLIKSMEHLEQKLRELNS